MKTAHPRSEDPLSTHGGVRYIKRLICGFSGRYCYLGETGSALLPQTSPFDRMYKQYYLPCSPL